MFCKYEIDGWWLLVKELFVNKVILVEIEDTRDQPNIRDTTSFSSTSSQVIMLDFMNHLSTLRV